MPWQKCAVPIYQCVSIWTSLQGREPTCPLPQSHAVMRRAVATRVSEGGCEQRQQSGRETWLSQIIIVTGTFLIETGQMDMKHHRHIAPSHIIRVYLRCVVHKVLGDSCLGPCVRGRVRSLKTNRPPGEAKREGIKGTYS
jgi:hypothetical protein